MPGRFAEWSAGRWARGRVVFTGTRRRMTSMAVRGDQMAEEMGGICLRHRYLGSETVASSPAVIWVVEADLERVKAFDRRSPQFLDVVNPAYPLDAAKFAPQYRTFRYLILTTRSSRFFIGPEPDQTRKTWVIPHHHCNRDGWVLPEERIERPRVIGYLGQPEHLHDADEVRAFVERIGFEFRMFDTTDLAGYRQIDIGIAWTRREEQRDLTRSNIKLSNFAAHGIPSVVCDYESYREVDDALGGVARICGELPEFLAAVGELATDVDARRRYARGGAAGQEMYSRAAVARLYWEAIKSVRETP